MSTLDMLNVDFKPCGSCCRCFQKTDLNIHGNPDSTWGLINGSEVLLKLTYNFPEPLSAVANDTRQAQSKT